MLFSCSVLLRDDLHEDIIRYFAAFGELDEVRSQELSGENQAFALLKRNHLRLTHYRCSKASTVAAAMRPASGIEASGRSPARSRATSAKSSQV
jgi:hypothetical protein